MTKGKRNILIQIYVILLGVILNSSLFCQSDSTNSYEYSLYELSKIKIESESKSEKEVRRSLSTMYIITRKDILENAYFTLDEVLADMPGFQFRNILGLNSYVFQRGIPAQNNTILVLIDGIQVNELNSGGFYGGGQYNLANIERIEVIYGPSSVMYGTNAISGIINIITKSTEQSSGISVNSLIGSFKTNSSDLNCNYLSKNKEFGLRAAGMYKTSEKTDLTGENGDYNWTDKMEIFEHDYAFDLKFHYKKISAAVNYQNRQSSTSTHYPSIGTNYLDHGSLWNIRFINNYIRYKNNFSKKIYFLSTVYSRSTTVLGNSVKIITDTSQIAYFRPNYLAGIENVINYDVHNNLHFTGGVLFEMEHLSTGYSNSISDSPFIKPVHPEDTEMESNSLFSLFSQLEYTLPFNLQMTCGLRFDNSSTYDQVITPRMGILYFNKNVSARILYTEAFRAPKPWDYTYGLGNKDLLPEVIKSLEFSTNYIITGHFVTNISIYKNNLSSALVKRYIEDDYRWENIGCLNTEGIEFGFESKISDLRFYFNYTYNNSYNENGEMIAEIAPHSANSGVRYTINNNYSIIFKANYYGERKNTKTITITGKTFIEQAVVFSTIFSIHRHGNTYMQLIIRNLFNTKYYHTSNLTPDRYMQPQRSYAFKIGYYLDKE